MAKFNLNFLQNILHIFIPLNTYIYYIDTSVLIQNIPLVKFIKTISVT